MVVVPAVTPVATPVDDPMIAMVVLPLIHIPPPAASVSAVVAPGHTCNVPPIADGPKFTVIVIITLQPDGIV